MKKVLHFFSRPDEDQGETATTYRPREPTLNPLPRVAPANAAAAAKRQSDPPEQAGPLPTGYAEIVAFFHATVAERHSPYNALVDAADRLQKFIPDETSRLQAALAICGDQWLPDALSLAISTHISDIETARKKARGNMHSAAAGRALTLRSKADQLKGKNAKIAAEIALLNESIAQLEITLNANNAAIAALDGQIQMAEADCNTVTFFDQAAENLKNDLLAKKVILGLP
jgi:hypothetical protein